MINENAKLWFPLRIRHSSAKKLDEMRELLEQEDAIDEVYIPLTFMKTSDTSMEFVPMLNNLLFVRTTLGSLRAIKSQRERFERLRFMMHNEYDEALRKYPEVVYMSDKGMADVKQIISNANDKVVFLTNPNFIFRPGQRVQITQGPFAGVVGTLKSFKKHICVVVPIGNVGAVGVTFVPKKHLIYLQDGKQY